MRLLACFVVVWAAGTVSLVQADACINATQPYTVYSLLNDANWDGRVVGFCEDLFNATDPIFPQTTLSCSGEMGNFRAVRNGMGALGTTCRTAVARLSCYASLPMLRTQPFAGPALPCTEEQATATAPLVTWLSGQCADDLDTVESVLASAAALDATFAATPALTAICRVVNGDGVFNPDWTPTLWECPEGLAKKDGSDLETEAAGCALPCPAPVYSESRYDTIEAILAVANSASFVGIVFTLASWLLIKDKLGFPSNLVFHFLVVICILHISLMIRKEGSYENVWCVDDYTRADQSHAACGAQATLVLYAGKACVMWWFIITLNGFLVFAAGNHTTELLVYKFLIGGYLYPAISPFIALCWDRLDYSVGSAWCFITSDDSGAYQYGLLYAELMLLVVVGVLLGTGTLVSLGRQDKQMDSAQPRTSIGKRQRHTFRAKVIVLLFWVGFELIWVLAFRLHGSVHEDDIRHSLEDWARCEFSVFTTQLDSPDYSSCTISTRPSYALLMLAVVFISGNGLVVFALFGLSEDVRMFWGLVLRHTLNNFRGRPDEDVERRLFAMTRFLYREQLRNRNAGRHGKVDAMK